VNLIYMLSVELRVKLLIYWSLLKGGVYGYIHKGE